MCLVYSRVSEKSLKGHEWFGLTTEKCSTGGIDEPSINLTTRSLGYELLLLTYFNGLLTTPLSPSIIYLASFGFVSPSNTPLT
mmetsp:Transcript_16649/g.36118  ORF Transcript_16649/g.36118 Transcript_16649/m.36118 type:complete len:83 (+) Transcript_16649:382-630(+)